MENIAEVRDKSAPTKVRASEVSKRKWIHRYWGGKATCPVMDSVQGDREGQIKENLRFQLKEQHSDTILHIMKTGGKKIMDHFEK